jgi:uncharacterized protein YjbI with pentapeptide repeats
MQKSATEQADDEETHSNIQAARSRVEEAYRKGERDFSKRELDGLSLAALTLEGVNLANGSLRRSELAHVNLQGANLAGTDLREADCNDVVLAGANLDGADLSEANFETAKLGGARFGSVKATGASFVAADLAESQWADARCAGADYSRTEASRATFARADLTRARFERAVLVGADFSGADLRSASFEAADLTHANLSDALLSGTNFSNASLTGATLPEGVPFETRLASADDLAQQHRTSLLSLLGLSIYVLVAALTTSDSALAVNRSLVTLPIADVELPLQLFFAGASAAVFVVFCYLHILQARLVRELAQLPRVFPDGIRRAERIHSSLVAAALGSWLGRENQGLERWTVIGAFLLAWGIAPLTILTLLLRFLPSQRAGESYLLWSFLAGAVAVGWVSYLGACRRRGQQPGRGVAVASVGLALLLLACLPGVLMGVHRFRIVAPQERISTFLDGEWEGADLAGAPLIGADFRLVRLDRAALGGARFDEANLMGAHLEESRAELASFVSADLSLSDFSRAFLWKAKLNDAVLAGSKGPRATLSLARIDRAEARGINLEAARAEGARFDGADLRDSVLRELDAPGAGFEGANLEGADLSGANLSSTNLRATKLGGTKLSDADLSEADLTASEGLTPDQLCSARNWRAALLPGDELSNSRRPFRIDEPGRLRKVAEFVCGARSERAPGSVESSRALPEAQPPPPAVETP